MAIHPTTPRSLLFAGTESEKPWFISHNPCPVALRLAMLGEGRKRCRCSNHLIPFVTDLEYDNFINGQMPGLKQILVVCIVSSRNSEGDLNNVMLEQLYEKKNKIRTMPCVQSRFDSFRLVKYDITGQKSSLLVQRHNVNPGMFLMYVQGKLLFANYIFNGYSKSIKDLQKQIAKTRGDYCTGYSLPCDFRFSPPHEVSAVNIASSVKATENNLQVHHEHSEGYKSKASFQTGKHMVRTDDR
ncbi:uncharacterized protein C3orf20-like [Latimeria chalumnae]|uniref:uncharacterized protein C3orf20-like n=1 Tax=Latimeria chalumnae TaxID=7897 RepID=UPI00313B9023